MLDERIKYLENEKIGLSRDGSVLLVDYNDRWKRCYSKEAFLIFDALKLDGLKLYHIGSTSVEGIVSKPIIDILGVVPSLKELDNNQTSIESLGYEYKGEYGIPGRRYCTLYNESKTHGYIHLHIFEEGNPLIDSHLDFRDYLRQSEDWRKIYEDEKNKIVFDLKVKRSDYSKEKNSVISKITKEVNAKDMKPKKIVSILGASDGHSNTMNFVESKYPNSEVIDLNQLTVNQFVYGKMPDDDFIPIIKKIIDADLTVLATPVYWYSMSSEMKIFIDRFSNLMAGEFKELGEALYGKKVKLLSTGHDLKLPYGFEVPFAATSIYFGIDYLGVNYESVR